MADSVEVDELYMCPICREVLKRPMFTRECLHSFCDGCLRQMRPNRDGALLCPLCRGEFQMAAIFRDEAFEGEMSRTHFICRGCKHKLPLLMYNGHQTTCRGLKLPQLPILNPVVQTSQTTPSARAGGVNRLTFKCPFCVQDNLDCEGLRDHVNQAHSSSTAQVVCPICASMPWGNPRQKSGNFVAHLNLRHKFVYETYVDYDQDEDAVLQEALRASLSDS